MSMKALNEIGQYLRSWCLDCKKHCQYATLTEVQTLQDITSEAEKDATMIARQAYRAEVAIDEAGKLLDEVLSDGRVSGEEISLLKLARRNVKVGARAEHKIAEVLS